MYNCTRLDPAFLELFSVPLQNPVNKPGAFLAIEFRLIRVEDDVFVRTGTDSSTYRAKFRSSGRLSISTFSVAVLIL